MNTKFTIKNFRVFDENGVSIDIRPLTILTGCNSSGKSSIVKAAFLLNSLIKQVNKSIEEGEQIQLSKYKLDFTQYPNNLLGRFDKVIPNDSESHKVTLGYTVYSHMISKDVYVELTFEEDINDDLNNAYLTAISMSTDEGVFYSSNKDNGNMCNLNIIKKYCQDYVKIEYLIDNYCGLYSSYNYGLVEKVSEEEFESQQKNIFGILRGFDRGRVIDVSKYIRSKKGEFRCIGTKEYLDLFEWTEQNDSYFYIPVVEYLSTIKKEDLESTIENRILPCSGGGAILASSVAIEIATKRIIDDFMNSGFSVFAEYFKDFEHRHFERLISKNNGGYPTMLSVGLKQNYTESYPGRGGMVWEAVPLFDEEVKQSEEEKERITQEKIKAWESQPLTFDILYEVVMLWNEKYVEGKNDYYREGQDVHAGTTVFPGFPDGFHHHVFEMLTTFAKRLAEEMICQTDFGNMSYVSSSRAIVEKSYDLNKKDDFTVLLQRYFEKKRVFKEKGSYKSSHTPEYEVDSFMNRWLKQFGIGDSLSFVLDEDGVGVKIFLHKDTEKTKRLLADEGYGITQLISIILQIETAILSAEGLKTNNFAGLTAFDRFDVSIFHFEENTIAIEEPEIHLHPSYQSKLAEMFAEAYNKYNIHFIIETHSEYLIRKLQTFVAHKKIESNDVSICYVYSKDDYVSPSDSRVKHLPIKEDGNLADSFGSGFFDEADNLSVELMSLKMDKS